MISGIRLAIIVIIVFSGCKAEKKNAINYLNQKPPGMKAAVFAPGIVSTNLYEHSAPAFSPDGGVVLWTVLDTAFRARLLEMKYENGLWSNPAVPSFADTTADDYYPSFSPDGKKLYFSSRRKVPQNYPGRGDIRIWEVDRNENGWGTPLPFDTTVSKGQDYAHSVTSNGDLYFSSSSNGGTNFDIMKSGRLDGKNANPKLLPYNINSVGYEDGPYISPDESFLIFESQRPGGYLSLYITFRLKDGLWGLPVNMGPEINSGKGERFARLSPDGKYLFFGSYRNTSAGKQGADIYWIDAKVIEQLRSDAHSKKKIEQPLGDEIIEALYKNDTASSARLLKQWLTLYPDNIDAIVTYASILRKQKRFIEAGQLLTDNTGQWKANTDIIIEQALIKFATGGDNEATSLLDTVLTAGNQLRERYLYISGALFDLEKFDSSDQYFEKAMAIYSHGVFWYNRACGYAHLNQKDRAFFYLDKASQLGYDEKKNYESDPDLASLQPDTRWKLLVKKLK